ncbi:MAG: winged helix-turn-helix transcriptional regulator [Pseudobacter sp.]|uniref:winged helix-turn-helix transcriptional regulator n=1 Tax=Pseudobacter sp. TaxID=2045420 RepID=UPI003F7F5558
MTTQETVQNEETCPAQSLLKQLSGKWKPEIFRLALAGPLRFNSLLKQIKGSNKQSLAIALSTLEEMELLQKITVSEKPLHIEYHLTERGKQLVPIFQQLEGMLFK